ncbi:hypothetical protein WJX81_000353 [Elliptochloris bilobata]|uniref:Uncharacterized protein n=1 Tax=Elliptochloris bilobata TaxID=381761 RepID=A0AAW1QJI0_9CHLO
MSAALSEAALTGVIAHASPVAAASKDALLTWDEVSAGSCAGSAQSNGVGSDVACSRREAAQKLASGRLGISNDILEKSGIVRPGSSQYGGTLIGVNGYPLEPPAAMVAAVEFALRRVASWLVDGSPGPQHPDVEGRALGSAAITYFLSAGSERIGLSSPAAEQLRHGCTEVLRTMY